MTNKLTCPKCGGTHIAEDDCYDTTIGENDTYREYICGTCEDCGANLQWVRVYKFVGYDDIEKSYGD